MHNKRIGRDDLLKIEVKSYSSVALPTIRSILLRSGLVLLPLPLGASIPDVTAVVSVVVSVESVVLVVNAARLAVEGVLHLLAAVVITLPARMIATTDVTVTPALEAQMIAIGR
jgi:hypothetical protein